ncbi:4Fe-4S binding protein [uncultured Adlercreutzia sp.]|uniref:4Fe-4S binding protein n=1 Tax=uncultured Adlercreutzia sp. TaxID=875803 RepID=UPI0026F409BD|nr:4Fe-4S binding protein [uncultured Adlercreutzia sp.]
MTENEKKTPSRRTVTRLRNAVLLVAFVGISVGLALHIGWGNLSSMGIGAIAAICPLGALETFVASKTLIPRAIIALAAIIVIAVLVGRMFCSWICPVPPLTRFFRPEKKNKGEEKGHTQAEGAGAAEPLSDRELSTLKAAMGHHHDHGEEGCQHTGGHHCGTCGSLPPVGGERDGRKIDTRHWVLGGSLVSAAIFGFPVFCLICPVGLTFATVIALVRALGYQEPTWSLLVFPAMLIVELVVLRKWCHKFCPMGALLSLLNWGNNKIRPKVDVEACLRSAKGVDCQVCVNVCPEKLDPHSDRIPECTKCGLCVDACPSKAISLLGRSKAKAGETLNAPAGADVLDDVEVVLAD